MKPLPNPERSENRSRRMLSDLPVLQSNSPSPANHRRTGGPIVKIYPWLLLLSTALSVTFGVLYITKPVIQMAGQAQKPIEVAPEKLQKAPGNEAPKLAAQPVSPPPLLPGNRLPGEKITAKPPRQVSAGTSATEQTNLSVQHVLNAQVAQGDICRIILDVPVVYKSRQLRWTQGEVEEARGLLGRLADYQEKTTMLRQEGSQLLADWNRLINRSIPAGDLRADSPSLPENQGGSALLNVPASLNTSESIQLKPAGK